MPTITVGFSRNKKIFSRLIRWAAGSGVSHCYITINHRSKPWKLVSHAQGMNVHYASYENFIKKNEIVEEYEVSISVETAALAEEMRWTKSGTPYGWMMIAGYLWVLFGRVFKKSWKNPYSDGEQTHVCVEWVAEQLGIKESENMTPEDLRRIVERTGLRRL